MKTLEEKADEYANSLRVSDSHLTQKQIEEYAIIDFKGGYKAAQEWISVDDELPLAYKSGEWDGLKSDEVMVKTKQGKHYIAVLYSGIMDGSQFNEFYESNCDFELNEITHWRPIEIN